MLTRLYKPFLWRALKVANSHVRTNAITLMLDAFPLVEPSLYRQEVDLELQRQFDLIRVGLLLVELFASLCLP